MLLCLVPKIKVRPGTQKQKPSHENPSIGDTFGNKLLLQHQDSTLPFAAPHPLARGGSDVLTSAAAWGFWAQAAAWTAARWMRAEREENIHQCLVSRFYMV